jgi:ribose transport system substrate-binding protein
MIIHHRARSARARSRWSGRPATRSALLAATAALLLLATGCSNGSPETPPTGNEGGSSKGRHLALIQGVAGDEFYISMTCGAKAAAEAAGATLDVQGPSKFVSQLQIPIVDQVVAKRPDAVLVAPTDTQALIDPLKRMQQAGIKVVEVDTHVDDKSVGVSEIASDNRGGGVAAAKQVAKLVGGKGSVLVVSVQPGVSTTDARVRGFEAEIKANYPGIKYLGVQYSEDEPTKAAQIVQSTLRSHPDLAGVFATNLLSAEGAATGLQAARNTRVKIVGFDAGPKQVHDLKRGIVHALVAQKPFLIGQLGVEQALSALDGKPVKPKIATDFTVVTKDNLDDPEVSKYLYKPTCSAP